MPRLVARRLSLFPARRGQPRDQKEALKKKPMAVQGLGHVALGGWRTCPAPRLLSGPRASRSPWEADDWTLPSNPRKRHDGVALLAKTYTQPDPFRLSLLRPR